MYAKTWKVILAGGHEYELDETNAKKVKERMRGSRATYSYEIQSGPNLGAVFNMGNIAAIIPVRSKAEEKEVIKAQKEELRKKQVRMMNVAAKNTSVSNTGNERIDLCTVLHKVQNEHDSEGNLVRQFYDKEIEPRFQNIGGRKVFFPVCTACGWRGQLMKSTSVDKIFGMLPDEVVEHKEDS